ncbi:MAG: alpha/beta fold hydrolase [Patescibacteria group bacterium]
MQKLFIKNRHDKKICVLVEKPEKPIGLAFVMHGLGGFKEQPHIRAFIRSFLDNNYTVISFDTTNTFGESDGNYSDATTTNYYEDLEDVIAWSKKQNFYQEPFILCGHSLGGICTALYAENYPEEIKALAPIAPVVSGELSFAVHNPEEMAAWEKSGWRTTIGYSSGLEKKLKWSHMEDRLKYNLLEKAEKLTMPTIIIVGEFDESCPPAHQEILFKAIPADKKELYIVKAAPHTFRDEEHLKEIYSVMDKWIKSLS